MEERTRHRARQIGLVVFVAGIVWLLSAVRERPVEPPAAPELPVAPEGSSPAAATTIGPDDLRTGDRRIEAAYGERASGPWVEARGTVERILADDRQGSRHQRFIVRLRSGRTLLVAHNIDIAPRVPVEVGDTVEFRGEYEWNDLGGVIHWTHHDPSGRQAGGWIRLETETYR